MGVLGMNARGMWRPLASPRLHQLVVVGTMAALLVAGALIVEATTVAIVAVVVGILTESHKSNAHSNKLDRLYSVLGFFPSNKYF